MTRVPRLLLLALLSIVAITLGGCSSQSAPPAPVEQTTRVRLADAAQARALIDAGAQVIDVRTPEEYDAGHLAGALNVDVQASDFTERIGTLDKGDSYVLYCRSGSRAGVAADLMLDLGFDDVVNAGGFDTLAAAGLATE